MWTKTSGGSGTPGKDKRREATPPTTRPMNAVGQCASRLFVWGVHGECTRAAAPYLKSSGIDVALN